MSIDKKHFSERWSEHRFISFDETPIFYRRYLTSQPLRGAVLILHGMGEHGGRYRELTEILGELGLNGYVPDLRGFGQSGGKKGCLHRFEDYFHDLNVVARLAKEQSNNLSLFVLGHSYGGLVASSWLASGTQTHFQGLVLTSPNFGIAIHVPRWRHWLAILGSYLAPDYTQHNRVDSNFLTHDPKIYEQYKMDRFIHHQISARLYLELVRQISMKNEIARKLTLPTLVLQAGNDRVVSKEATIHFFEHLVSQDKQLEIFPDLYHEILNEKERHSIFSKISEWIRRHL